MVWVLLSPMLGATAALFGSLFERFRGTACVISTISLAVPAVLLALLTGPVMEGEVLQHSLGGWSPPWGINLVMDGLAWVSASLTTLIAVAVALFALDSGKYGARFFFFLLMMAVGMYGVALTGDLFTMFVCFEIIAVSVYVLVAWEGTGTGLAASLKYLILSTTGIMIFLFGVFLIYRDLGVLSISGVSEALRAAGGVRNTPVMHLALASLCVGIGVRTAFIPFHTWLPEAHAYAPHPISAFLSGAMIKISFFAMVRIVLEFGGDYLMDLLMWIGAFTALAAVLSALSQTDVKRLLAYHSISQLGYILAVFGAGSSLALTASFLHALNHALFKSLLFLTVGAAVSFTGERNIYRIHGLGSRMPVVAAAFFVGALSISGIPPFNGYASKAFITMGMKGSGAYPLLWATSFLTMASFIKLGRIFLPFSRSGAEYDRKERPPGILETSVVAVLALMCLGTGVFGSQVAGFMHSMLYGTELVTAPRLFTAGSLLKTLPMIALGILAWRMVLTGPGRSLSGRVRALAPQLRTVLIFFFAGLLAFAAVAY